MEMLPINLLEEFFSKGVDYFFEILPAIFKDLEDHEYGGTLL